MASLWDGPCSSPCKISWEVSATLPFTAGPVLWACPGPESRVTCRVLGHLSAWAAVWDPLPRTGAQMV
jgi:hypothetical protein